MQEALSAAHQEQLQREQREHQRARQAAIQGAAGASQGAGKNAILTSFIKALSEQINAAMTSLAANPDKAGPHHAAMAFFEAFKGPEQIAAVTLAAALRHLDDALATSTFAIRLGKAAELERRALLLEEKNPNLLRHMRRTFSIKAAIVAPKNLARVGVIPEAIDAATRFKVGAFLLDQLAIGTGLIEYEQRRNWKAKPGKSQYVRVVAPSAKAIEILSSVAPSRYMPRTLASVVPPRDWTSLWEGGDMLGEWPVVTLDKIRRHTRSHYRYLERPGRLKALLALVNRLQAIPLHVDGEMVRLLCQAWDEDPGSGTLFPCTRYPREAMRPDALTHEYEGRKEKSQARAWRQWRETDTTHENTRIRIRIERFCLSAQELAGRRVWNTWQADFRGRLYTRSAMLTHQGPSRERSVLTFADGGPVDAEALDWMLWAAAGAWDGSKASRAERVAWGQANVRLMQAVAEDPLNRVALWQDCKEPWPFLQLAREITWQLKDPGRLSGVLIRFDQTTSGLGIIAALSREHRLAAVTNMIGQDRGDVYTLALEGLVTALQREMEVGETEWRKRTAMRLLEYGPDRSLLKQFVMPVPYGLKFMRVEEIAQAWVEGKIGRFVPFDRWTWDVQRPAGLLAHHVHVVVSQLLPGVKRLERWLNGMAAKAVKSGARRLEWSGPSGLPVRLEPRPTRVDFIQTVLSGRPQPFRITTEDLDKPLALRDLQGGLCANYVHSHDAALAQDLLRRMPVEAPVLPTHDCFAVRPCDASRLKLELHANIREYFKVDHLAKTRKEVEASCNVGMQDPPVVGDLDIGRIGENDFLYS